MGSSALLIAGAGGHARACIDVVEAAGAIRIGGLMGRPDEVGQQVLGYRVLGSESDIAPLRAEHDHALVGVGQIKSYAAREQLFDLLAGHGFTLATIVSPRAYVSPHAEIGAGSIVMHGAVVNAGARIGRNCIINSMALVEHDVSIDDHCHVATGARVNGGVVIGSRVFIGSGSTILQGARIGSRSIVAMGAQVRHDCPEGTTVTPTRRQKP